ncbi:MAG TPA: HK97 gp10 family phage protein [Desulfatiglandales bacterium]|nr:HK97 gp10 family phage protein [Desulfatiglandales bacterium]
MSRIAFWNPKIADKEVLPNAMKRLEKAGEVVAEKARAKCPVGTVSRPMYKKGRYAGQFWTARDAGALKKSIRVVRKYDDKNRNIRVYAGTKKAYYAQIVEYYTPYLRPALNASKYRIKKVLENG